MLKLIIFINIQNNYYLPRSTWSRVSVTQKNGNTTWRFGSAMLIISAMLVLIAVLAIAGLALWMGGMSMLNFIVH